MNLLTEQKQTHRLREPTYGYRGGRVEEGIVREFGIDTYTLLYLKWMGLPLVAQWLRIRLPMQGTRV